MTYEQLTAYLAEGGTDLQYVIESVQSWTTDPNAVAVIGQLFENIEAE